MIPWRLPDRYRWMNNFASCSSSVNNSQHLCESRKFQLNQWLGLRLSRKPNAAQSWTQEEFTNASLTLKETSCFFWLFLYLLSLSSTPHFPLPLATPLAFLLARFFLFLLFCVWQLHKQSLDPNNSLIKESKKKVTFNVTLGNIERMFFLDNKSARCVRVALQQTPSSCGSNSLSRRSNSFKKLLCV